MPKKKSPIKKKTVQKSKPVKTSKPKTVKKVQILKKTKSAPALTKEKPASVKKTEKKTESMSQREKLIQDIKQSLLAQRETLLKEAEETLNTLPSELNFPDMGDQATAETDRNFILRLRDRERMLLKKIEETIERIDSAEYGICQECGNEIGIKRLQARPVTTLCIDCKTRQEEEERITEGG
jgi:DnaK suppressor protein